MDSVSQIKDASASTQYARALRSARPETRGPFSLSVSAFAALAKSHAAPSAMSHYSTKSCASKEHVARSQNKYASCDRPPPPAPPPRREDLFNEACAEEPPGSRTGKKRK